MFNRKTSKTSSTLNTLEANSSKLIVNDILIANAQSSNANSDNNTANNNTTDKSFNVNRIADDLKTELLAMNFSFSSNDLVTDAAKNILNIINRNQLFVKAYARTKYFPFEKSPEQAFEEKIETFYFTIITEKARLEKISVLNLKGNRVYSAVNSAIAKLDSIAKMKSYANHSIIENCLLRAKLEKFKKDINDKCSGRVPDDRTQEDIVGILVIINAKLDYIYVNSDSNNMGDIMNDLRDYLNKVCDNLSKEIDEKVDLKSSISSKKSLYNLLTQIINDTDDFMKKSSIQKREVLAQSTFRRYF